MKNSLKKQNSGLLQDIRVVDMTRVLAGPFCTRLMADLGAEVIKIEPPGGDVSRIFPFVTEQKVSGYYLQANCGKKSICLDLRQPKGIDIVKALVKISDVLVENFAPGVMGRFGLDYPALSAINPALVMCSVSGFGQSGPLSDLPSADRPIQAMAGVTWITGFPSGPPTYAGMSIGDTIAGAHAFGAICAALHSRDVTGKGQYLDISLLHSLIYQNEWAFQTYLLSGGKVNPTRHGNRQPVVAPCDIYKIKDSYISLVCASDSGWQNIAQAMGKPELVKDPRFATLDARLRNREALETIMQQWLDTFDSVDEAVRLIRDEKRILCSKVNTVADILNDPQVQARGVFAEINDPLLGPTKVTNCPIKSSPTPSRVRSSAPLLGESTLEVLGDLLGYSKREILDLLSDGTVIVGEQALPELTEKLVM